MARLPDPDSQSLPVPKSGASVVRRQGGIVERAKGQAANVIGQTEKEKARASQQVADAVYSAGEYVTNTMMEIQQRRDREAYAKAQTEFARASIALEDEIAQTDDYSNYAETYADRLNEVRDEITGKIQDRYLRSQFMQDVDLSITKGQVRLTNLAREKHAQEGIARIQERDEERHELLTKAETDSARNQLIAAGMADVEMAESNDWMDPTQAVTARQQMAEGYAKTILASMPDAEILQHLEAAKKDDSHWANYIPPADRERAMEVAREEVEDAEAMAIADTYADSGMSLDGGYAAAQKIKDPSLREKVETRWEREYRVREAAKDDMRADLYNQTYLGIRAGETHFDDLSREQKLNLTPAMRENLRNAEVMAIEESFPAVSDQAVIDELYLLQEAGRWRQARQFLMNNANKLTPSKYDEWSKITAQAAVPFEVKGVYNGNQKINMIASEMNYTDPKKAKLQQSFSDWYQLYERMNEKQPDAAAVDAAIDKLMMDTTIEGVIFDTTQPAFMNKPKAVLAETIKQSDPEGFKMIEEALTEEGDEVTPENIVDNYRAYMGY